MAILGFVIFLGVWIGFALWALQKKKLSPTIAIGGGFMIGLIAAGVVMPSPKSEEKKATALQKPASSKPAVPITTTHKYEPAVVTLQGTLLSAVGKTPDGEKITFPAIQLVNPITVQGTSVEEPTENNVTLLHMVLDEKTRELFKSLKGNRVIVNGTLFHSDNGNHQTNVLITPTSIAADSTSPAIAQARIAEQPVQATVVPNRADPSANNVSLDFLFKRGGYWGGGENKSRLKCSEYLQQSEDVHVFTSYSPDSFTIRFGIGDKRLYKEIAKEQLKDIVVPAEYSIVEPSPQMLKVKLTSRASSGAIIEEFFEVNLAENYLAKYAVGSCVNCNRAQLMIRDEFLESKKANPNFKEYKYWCDGNI